MLVVPSAARTASGSGSSFVTAGAPGADTLSLGLNVTAVGGATPSLTVKVEWSFDGGATFLGGDAFPAKTAVGTDVLSVAMRAPIARVLWTITGTTPSFTFDVNSFSS